MPKLKARIFTSHPDHVLRLTAALQQQGYVVEVLTPGQTPDSPADLEIDLETCSSADVVLRAAELASRLDADVAVAPGTLQTTPQTAVEKMAREIVAQETNLAPRLDAPRRPLQESSVAENSAQQTGPSGRESGELDILEPGSPPPSFWARAIPTTAVALTAWATAFRGALLSARDQVREYREKALTAIARARAEREERLLEITHRRIEAQEHASELASARKNAAVFLRQLERENGRLMETSSDYFSSKKTSEAPRPWHGLIEKLRKRVRHWRWDAVLAGTASAGALFAIGLAVASFNSKPLVTTGDDRPSAATASPGPAVPQPSPAKTSAGPAARARARKPSPAEHRQADRAGNVESRQRTALSRDQAVANDVTIRHLASATPSPKVQAQGWKHFSDMDH